jgi:hypothetical protein
LGLLGSRAIVAIVVGAPVAIGIYLRSKAKRVAVSATFDQTGLVQVLIKKTGIPTVHVVAIQPEMGVGIGLSGQSLRLAGSPSLVWGTVTFWAG